MSWMTRFVLAAVLFCGSLAQAAPPVIGVARHGAMNWLGNDLRMPVTFTIAADSTNILIVDANQDTFPMLVRRPDDPYVYSGSAMTDTLAVNRNRIADALLRSGWTVAVAAESAAAYLSRSDRVLWTRVENGDVVYQLINDPSETTYRPARITIPPRAVQLMNYLQPTLDALDKDRLVLVAWSGRTDPIAPVNRARVEKAIAAIRRGEDHPNRVIGQEFAELNRRPVNRLTLRMREDGR